MSVFDYPLLLEPIPVPRPWGGGRVCRLYDREGEAPAEPSRRAPAEPIGEWWDVSTWPTDPGNPGLATVTKIANGPLRGTPLDRVADVPVVVKLLDSAEKLSVQAHPVSADVHKDEMWYILHAEPGAYLFCGLADGVDPAEFCKRIRSDNPRELEVLAMLRRADDVKPGMRFNVPTGTVHAVGPGLVAFEISERTQVTYRLFDYNRGRALHLDDGCRAVTAARPDLPPLEHGLAIEGADEVEALTGFPTFCVLKIRGKRITLRSARHMHLVTAAGGDCGITGAGAEWTVALKHASTCLVPPTSKPYAIESAGDVLISPLRDPG